jgi:hypothetical protein
MLLTIVLLVIQMKFIVSINLRVRTQYMPSQAAIGSHMAEQENPAKFWTGQGGNRGVLQWSKFRNVPDLDHQIKMFLMLE